VLISRGDFGLPYQGFESLLLPGTRRAWPTPTWKKCCLKLPLSWISAATTASCCWGRLADRLGRGEGFDISKGCVEVGNAVAAHLGQMHIQLHHVALDDFGGKTTAFRG